MDWAGIEPAASSMPRKRSTTDLPARSTIVERHWLKELFLCCCGEFSVYSSDGYLQRQTTVNQLLSTFSASVQ
jgi:hypothetical protein